MRIEITLGDVKPAVVRRVEGPFDIRLDRLPDQSGRHGWTKSHLYELHAGDVGWRTPYPDADWSGDFLDARKARLGNVLEDIGTKKPVHPTLSDAILDRVVHNAYRIELSDDSLRKKRTPDPDLAAPANDHRNRPVRERKGGIEEKLARMRRVGANEHNADVSPAYRWT
jgi:hypothetical protein